MPTSPGAALHRRAGTPDPESGRVHHIRPEDAGWRFVGFDEHRLAAGAGLTRPADDHEVAIIVLEGTVSARAGRRHYPSLGSRASVFDGPPPPVLLLAPGTDV